MALDDRKAAATANRHQEGNVKRAVAVAHAPANLPPALQAALERLGGQWDVLEIVCKMFIARCPTDRAALATALQERDAIGVARNAHRLRGALGQVNTGRPFELCAVI